MPWYGLDRIPRGIGVGIFIVTKRVHPQITGKVWILNYIVTDHSGSQETFYKAAWPGVSSTEKGRVIGGRKVNQQEIRVDSITLNDLLEREGVESVDFLSMDIEGAEPQALAGFDIQRFKPKLVCIEAMVHKRDELLKYFESHGYRLIERYQKRDPVNWYFEPVPSEKDPG